MKTDDRLWNWAQHIAELISETEGGDCTVTSISEDGEIEFDLQFDSGQWIGTLVAGGDVRDVEWKEVK